jgi:hypothetical protein
VTGHRIIAFLARPDARPTHVYERRIVLLVEALCLLAVVLVAPAGMPTYLLLLRAPLQLRKAAADHAARSGAARRREHEEVLGRDPVKLTCARELEREASNGQILTAGMPLVDLAFAFALTGEHGIRAAAIVSTVCTFARIGMVEGYGVWRRWYRARRPLVPPVIPERRPGEVVRKLIGEAPKRRLGGG